MRDRKILEFLEDLSSSKPSPGGGSAGDLILSISASLISMVFSLSKGIENYSDEVKILRDEFFNLSIEDEDVFNKVMDAYKLPKNSEEEKKFRREKIEEVLKNATEIPFKALKLSKKLIPYIEILLKDGNKNAISDVGVAILSLKSGAISSYLNVLINLKSIKDIEFIQKIKSEAEKIKREIEEFCEKSFNEVLNYLNQ
jgi:formiminotetrahydrofolate cyclodeaminase